MALRTQLTMANYLEQMSCLDIFEAVWVDNIADGRHIQMDRRLFDCLRVRVREPFQIQARKVRIFVRLMLTGVTVRELAFQEVVNCLQNPQVRVQLFVN